MELMTIESLKAFAEKCRAEAEEHLAYFEAKGERPNAYGPEAARHYHSAYKAFQAWSDTQRALLTANEETWLCWLVDGKYVHSAWFDPESGAWSCSIPTRQLEAVTSSISLYANKYAEIRVDGQRKWSAPVCKGMLVVWGPKDRVFWEGGSLRVPCEFRKFGEVSHSGFRCRFDKNRNGVPYVVVDPTGPDFFIEVNWGGCNRVTDQGLPEDVEMLWKHHYTSNGCGQGNHWAVVRLA